MIWVTLTAIICIAGLEALALIKGVNGARMGLACTASGGLGGYEVKTLRDKLKGGK